MTVCWVEFMDEGKNFPKSHFSPALGDQVSREGPADVPTLGRTERGHLDLTIPGGVEGHGTEMPLFPLLQVSSSRRVPVVQEPAGRWVEVKSLPKKAGGGPGGISVFSREERAEALGLLNVLFHTHLASADIIHLHSSSHPPGDRKEATGPSSAYNGTPKTNVPAST